MLQSVFITGRGLNSPAGFSFLSHRENLFAGHTAFSRQDRRMVGRLHPTAENILRDLVVRKEYRHLDRAVMLGLLAAREAATGGSLPSDTAVLMGTSRGATERLEDAIRQYNEGGSVSPWTSPVTTAGTFAAAITRDLGLQGLGLSVSSACTTSLHAVGLAALLVDTGQAEAALAGGAEACLTPFTLEMLQSTGVYSKSEDEVFPCQPLHSSRSGLVLGEGAAVVLLERRPTRPVLARIVAYAGTSEKSTMTGITESGELVDRVIQKVLRHSGIELQDISFIVGHGASTRRGDEAELNGLRRAFGNNLPPLVFHKWHTGHLLGASGALSLALAADHLQTGRLPPHPYWQGEDPLDLRRERLLKEPRYALVISLGFGGNAGAILLSRN